MSQGNDLYSAAPQDAQERERLANVHPTGWRNPPARRDRSSRNISITPVQSRKSSTRGPRKRREVPYAPTPLAG